MAERIRLYSGDAVQLTAISNIFIDQYMPTANGEFVKIYLYLVRCMQHNCCPCTLGDIADLFDHTENDILRALKYWERQGLMALEYEASVLTGIRILDPATAAAPASVTGSLPGSALLSATGSLPGNSLLSTTGSLPGNSLLSASGSLPGAPLLHEQEPTPREYSAEELTAFGEDPQLQELFFIIQSYMQHPLSDTDTNLVLFWYDELGFSAELVEYLVEYCITKGHYSTSYMNKVALGWAKNGITTVSQARENAQMHSQIYYAVIKALGIHGRNLVAAENEFIRKWTKDYGFSQELIEEACARTVAATHQPSFAYADSILARWNKENVHSLQDVEKADEVFNQQKKKPAGDNRPQSSRPAANNKFNNFNQRTYNEADLEKMLLQASMGSSNRR